MPDATIDRRRVLAGGGLLALLAIAAPACGSTPAPPAPVDDLRSQLESARQDSRLATAAGAFAPPALVPALAEVAAERAEHARALTTEIARVTGVAEPGPTETSSPAAGTEAPIPPTTVPDVLNALSAAADSAGKLAMTSSGYRAGLFASIAAACTAAYQVALVPQP